jgi:hypothetical protein
VYLAGPHRSAKLKRGAAIGCPRQFPDVITTLHLLDAQAFSESGTSGQVSDELCDGLSERLLVARR